MERYSDKYYAQVRVNVVFEIAQSTPPGESKKKTAF
jgi:hypothetical protein